MFNERENIINDGHEIIDYELLKDNLNSGIENCLCKLEIENKNDNKVVYGTGFFCDIPMKNIKVFITCNHLLSRDFIEKESKLAFYTHKNEKKEINLKNRYIITDENHDFTLIEVLKEDDIKDFLSIDESLYLKNYIGEIIYIPQFPNGGKLKYAQGKIIKKYNYHFGYTIGTKRGSSGSPAILIKSNKLISLHKGKCGIKRLNKLKFGIPMNIIINSIYSIVCVYNITEKNVGKEVQIINDKYYDYTLKKYVIINNELKNKIK